MDKIDYLKGNLKIGFIITVLLLGILSVYFIAIVFANPDTYISTCTNLNIPGETYYLTADIWDSNEKICMNITAENVTLDCQNHWIDKNQTQSFSKGIYSSSSYTTIKNCKIKNYYQAIDLSNRDPISGLSLGDVDNSELENIMINNSSCGIQWYAGNNLIMNNITTTGSIWTSRNSDGPVSNMTVNNSVLDSQLIYGGDSGFFNVYNTIINGNRILCGSSYYNGFIFIENVTINNKS